eukprot:250757-Chlamydomonas_euryale.AAC.16
MMQGAQASGRHNDRVRMPRLAPGADAQGVDRKGVVARVWATHHEERMVGARAKYADLHARRLFPVHERIHYVDLQTTIRTGSFVSCQHACS